MWLFYYVILESLSAEKFFKNRSVFGQIMKNLVVYFMAHVVLRFLYTFSLTLD